MLLAEGSDWFWWYGSDQSSGNDDYFGSAFRNLLKNVYTSLDQEPCLLYTSPSPRDRTRSRMPSSA